jgi:hypothetical protein
LQEHASLFPCGLARSFAPSLDRALISRPRPFSTASSSSCAGCPRRIARRALKEHNSENIEFHLGLINKAAVQVCIERLHACFVHSILRTLSLLPEDISACQLGIIDSVLLGQQACTRACMCASMPLIII